MELRDKVARAMFDTDYTGAANGDTETLDGLWAEFSETTSVWFRHADAAIATVQEAGWQDMDDRAKSFGCVIACRAGQEDSVGPVWWRRGKWTMEDGETWKDGWLTHFMPLSPPPFEGTEHD